MNRPFCLSFAVVCTWALPIYPQATQTIPTRDPQAITVATKALEAVGGIAAVGAINDFRATGTITYSWTDKDVSGSVSLRGLGPTMLRLDAQLPGGTMSWFACDNQGAITDTSGKTSPIEFANAIQLGSETFPYLRIATALSSPSFSISSQGTETVGGRQGIVIQIQRVFSTQEEPTGDATRLSTKMYVIDPDTFVLLETKDTMWSDDGRMRPITHEVLFSNFTNVNGIIVPLLVTEKLGGQQTWSLQLNSVSFNTGLTADIFQ